MIKKLLFYILFTCILASGASKSFSQIIKKIEPPFWWSEMVNQDLQIMIYGEKISEYKIEIDKKDFFKDIEQVENPNYVFINLSIPQNIKSTSIKIEFKNGDKIVETVNYEIKERKKNKTQHQGFDNSDVIYLLMPDRFSNGNITNDDSDQMFEKANRNNPDGRHGGDIRGIINHLDYFNDLGVTTLWINPLLENNQEKYTYHGYAISDFYNIDPRYGNNEDYQNLVNIAHEKNLKIIMDVVLNHCGISHWWIKDLPTKDWIHQFSEYTQSNFRSPVLLDPYASDYDRNLQQNGWFDRNMPDLNQQNKLLSKYLIQNTIWWVENSGIDGIRLDTQPYADKDMVSDWAKAITNEYPDFTIVGEAWLQKIPITAYWQKTTRNFDGYSSNIPVVTDFPLHYAISETFSEEQTWTNGMAKLYYVLAQDFAYSNPMNTLVFLDNHDVTRIFSTLNKDIDKLKMAIAFQLTTRGIPSVYYGTELLMEGFSYEQHGKMRQDFLGGWPNDTINCFTQKGRTLEQNDIYNYYRKILNWRKSNEAIISGKLMHFVPENNIYVYFRYTERTCVMVILNNNNSNQTINANKFSEVISNYNTGFEINSEKEIKNLDHIEINKKSAMIIELKK